MLLLLSVFQPAVALDVDPDFEQIYEIGTRLLGDIEHEKELYGLGGVNFDNLYIGEYIPAYIAKETGLVLSDVRNYPVLENGEWVATLTCNVNIQEALAADRPVSGYVRLVLDDGTISGHMVAIRGYVSYYNSSEYVGSFTYVENETYPATSVAVSVTHAQSTLAQLNYYYYLGKLRGAFTQFCISSDEIF